MTDRKAQATTLRTALVDLIIDHVHAHPGQNNAEIAIALGLESSFEGGQRNYLSFALLGDAVRSGRIKREKAGRNIRYVPT